MTDSEILEHRIGYSNSKEALVFPIFDVDGELLMWQSRYFGHNSGYPKYLTKGLKGDILHYVGDHPTSRVVLVEDLISAIVVGRVENSMPLWGSTIHLKTLRQLAHTYSEVVLWLDADKLANSLKMRGTAELLFDSVAILNTDKDPKHNSVEEVKQLLDKRDKP